jgi:hypothetical protein
MSNSPAIQPRIHKSYTKILRKWLDAGLHVEMRLLVLDGLLRNGAMQLSLRDSAGDVHDRREQRVTAAATLVDARCDVAGAPSQRQRFGSFIAASKNSGAHGAHCSGPCEPEQCH